LDEAALDRARASLERERDSLRAELREHGADPDDPNAFRVELDSGFADRAETTTERARLLSVVATLRDDLKEVDEALARVREGRYGICESCGDPIAPERLEAMASARLCIDCKQRAR